MKSVFDEFSDKLQEEVLEDIRKNYSETVIDHWMHPRNFGSLAQPDGFARITGNCGDTMQIFLAIKNKRITDCRYLTDGCGTSIACGSIVTELAKGKSLDDAKNISHVAVLESCDGLPPENEHCALLASNTLIEAIRNYERQIQHQDPCMI